MSGINGIAFNGYNVGAYGRYNAAPQEPVEKPAVNFRANDYPYYNEEPQKKKSPLLGIVLTLIAAAGAVAGMGYVHKTNAISKMDSGWMKDTLTKCEPAFEKCHEACEWVRATGKDGWDKVSGWFNK